MKAGLIGEKLTHSISPTIHGVICKVVGIENEYNIYEIPRDVLGAEIDGIRRKGIRGINVTIPYKETVISYVDDITPNAMAIGAINTISFKGGTAIGYNTDYDGFSMMLKNHDVCVSKKRVVVLGTGGAAKCVMKYLDDNKAGEIYIVTRNKSSNMYSDEEITFINYKDMSELEEGDILINTTPVGMYPNIESSPVSEDVVKKFKVVVDLIYNPEETMLLKMARENGIKAVNGLDMLIGQAIKAEEIWNELVLSQKTYKEIFNKVYKKIGKKRIY
jgi:shikimate dehydrogenase